jgi:hypothetical protein
MFLRKGVPQMNGATAMYIVGAVAALRKAQRTPPRVDCGTIYSGRGKPLPYEVGDPFDIHLATPQRTVTRYSPSGNMLPVNCNPSIEN